MKTVADHPHSFLLAAWPFREPSNALSFTSLQILEQALPILSVFHDRDGYWQFLHGGDFSDDDLKIVYMGCMYERDPSIAVLADLPRGWSACRSTGGSAWNCQAYEDSEAHDG
jgi:hypothetical protein